MGEEKAPLRPSPPMTDAEYWEFLDEMMVLFQDKEEREVIIINNPKL